MAAETRQYDITLGPQHISSGKRLLHFLGYFVFFVAFWWAYEQVLGRPQQPLIEVCIMPFVLALMFTFFLGRPHPATLEIGEDFVERCIQIRWFTLRKRIFRNKVKSASEINLRFAGRGLAVMDRGEFGSRMLGFVFVPATTPEYEEIKSQLVSWAPLAAAQ